MLFLFDEYESISLGRHLTCLSYSYERETIFVFLGLFLLYFIFILCCLEVCIFANVQHDSSYCIVFIKPIKDLQISLVTLGKFKVGLSPSKKNFFICFNDRPSKMIHLKRSFRSQDIQIFVLTFWACRKSGLIRKIRNPEIYDVTVWLAKNYNRKYCSISQELKATRQ